MIPVQSIEEIETLIKRKKITLLYISRKSCSVCHSLKPQIDHLLKDFPTVHSFFVNADALPEIAGSFSIFTVPAILVFFEGKEMIRKARFVPIDELRTELSKLISITE